MSGRDALSARRSGPDSACCSIPVPVWPRWRKAAIIALPLLRIFHPPGIALARYPALLYRGPLFAVDIVLPLNLPEAQGEPRNRGRLTVVRGAGSPWSGRGEREAVGTKILVFNRF